MGITFKENVSDIRNSRVIDIIEEHKNIILQLMSLMHLQNLKK